MTGGSPSRLFGVRAFVYPPVLSQTVVLTSPSIKLPHSLALLVGQRQGFKATFHLAKVNQVLRHSFFRKDFRDHDSVTASPLHSSLQALSAAILKVIQES